MDGNILLQILMRRTGGQRQDVTGWPADPKLVRHLKSNLIRTCVHVDEAVMGLSVHTDEDGAGDNPLLLLIETTVGRVPKFAVRWY